ncbi:MAG: preprotein translocase subunit YajC [Oscillospiraceae bacterium]|nr:preprotein translocase subunit YajC [Oscillospiraceae bacterium]MBP1567163.1 preprotein translocase subunit YajC [Oscillospiraceae bacterium]MBQ5336172.1 preprotein translocase subunit YajC [Oscillospiraceae bacterium]
MNFTPVILAEAAASGGSTTSAMLSMLITFVPLFAVFYFLIVRPQKKREKEEKEMRESISIGDEIITIGGIIGLVVRQTDDTLVIETGGDRSKLRIQKSAVKENVTARERMQAAAVEEKKNAGPDKTEKSKKES